MDFFLIYNGVILSTISSGLSLKLSTHARTYGLMCSVSKKKKLQEFPIFCTLSPHRFIIRNQIVFLYHNLTILKVCMVFQLCISTLEWCHLNMQMVKKDNFNIHTRIFQFFIILIYFTHSKETLVFLIVDIKIVWLN